MKTLVVYASTHSSTLWCARTIAARLEGATEVHPANTAPSPMLYNCVILGSAIYAGASLPSMQTYCRQYQHELCQVPLHLFICCINPVTSIVQRQLLRAYPAPLRQHAAQATCFGGAITFANLNSKEKALMRILGYTNDHSTIDMNIITTFINQVSHSHVDR